MKIGAQLFTVRDFTRTLDDFAETLKKIADFLSVDAAFLSGNTPHVSGEMGEPVFSNCAESPLAGEIRSHVERLIGLSDEPLLEKLKRELEKNFPVAAATEFADRK